MTRFLRIQAAALLFAGISFTVYAFASSGTNLSAGGGEGVGAISGWTVSNVHYRLDGSAALSAVEFDLDKSAEVVKISLDSSNVIYFDCLKAQGLHWVCDINLPVGISSMNELRVIAAGTK